MMTEMPKTILFICMSNVNRSNSFENLFKKKYPDIEVRSTGIYGAEVWQMDLKLLDWADLIIVMDLEQENWIRHRFPEVMLEKVSIAGISDQYDRDSPEVERIFEYWFEHKWPIVLGDWRGDDVN